MNRAAPGDRVTPSIVLAKRLGEGGMGSVWLAEHEGLRNQVVVKLMAQSLVRNADFRARFAREAAAAATVRSPHVVQVFDTGISEELGPYIVMERLEGRDLAARLEGGATLSIAETLVLVEQVARALDAAHARGVVHRDIKPANLFLCSDLGAPFFVKVLDFGVARLAGDDAGPTATGVAIGTPTYMSPEQAAGAREVGPASDLYSLGLVAFRALTGAVAFPPETLEALSLGVYNLPPPRLSERRPSLPAAVDAWFARACAKDPTARFDDAGAMARALAEALADAKDEPAPESAPRSEGPTGLATRPSTTAAPLVASEPQRKERSFGTLGLAVAATLLVGAFVLLDKKSPPPAAPAPSPIPVGVLLDRSNVRKHQGQALEDAMRAAVKRINESGGPRGRPIELVVVDDEGDTGAHLDAAVDRLLARPGLAVILGPMTSEQVLRVAPKVHAAGAIEITPSATSAELSTLEKPGERTLFRTTPSDAVLARALVRVAKGTKCSRLAIVAKDNAVGAAFTDEVRRAFEEGDRRVVATLAVPFDARIDYTHEVRAVADAKADCEAVAIGPKAAARYLRTRITERARGALLSAPITFGLADLATEDFLTFARDDARDPASPSAGEGVHGVRASVAPTWRPEYMELTHLVADAAQPYVASAFDATILAALALEKAGPEARGPALALGLRAVARGGLVYGPGELPEMLRAIRRGAEVDYGGASGDVEVDANGDVDADIDRYTIRDGKVVSDGRVPRE